MLIVFLIRTIGKQDDDGIESGMDEPSGSREGVIWLLLGEPNLKNGDLELDSLLILT